MDLPSLLKYCNSNKEFCNNDNIWLQRLNKEFPNEFFVFGMNPKERYILLHSLRDVKEKLRREETLEELYNLKELDLSKENLTEIPDSIGNLINLRTLLFYNNKLTKIPDSIGNLYNLELLNLRDNNLTEIPDSLKNLSNLKYLYLGHNRLIKIPDFLKKNPKLTIFL